jgi:hypothetical protein
MPSFEFLRNISLSMTDLQILVHKYVQNHYYIRFMVLKAVTMRISVFWVMTPYGYVHVYTVISDYYFN